MSASHLAVLVYGPIIIIIGIVPRMLQMTREAPNIQLALSLHAPTQEMRQRIVPAGRAFKLDKVMGKESWACCLRVQCERLIREVCSGCEVMLRF